MNYSVEAGRGKEVGEREGRGGGRVIVGVEEKEKEWKCERRSGVQEVEEEEGFEASMVVTGRSGIRKGVIPPLAC